LQIFFEKKYKIFRGTAGKDEECIFFMQERLAGMKRWVILRTVSDP
jgi:hypothetical protein